MSFTDRFIPLPIQLCINNKESEDMGTPRKYVNAILEVDPFQIRSMYPTYSNEMSESERYPFPYTYIEFKGTDDGSMILMTMKDLKSYIDSWDSKQLENNQKQCE